ncbi:MAG: hypothetical protein IJ043_08445 [Clostridia bacterium]|nr:hypothetical protein [Clostridia bacterium]
MQAGKKNTSSRRSRKELDRYAADLGIELIPCIQTFRLGLGNIRKRTTFGSRQRSTGSTWRTASSFLAYCK